MVTSQDIIARQPYFFVADFVYYYFYPFKFQEEAAKEMKEKHKKEMEKLKHLDLSE